MAWDPVERAVNVNGWLDRDTQVALHGGKGARRPQPPKPPEVGWWEKRQKADEKERRHVARLKRMSRTQ